ncbi:ABC transporter substrate-binding protein [Chloroflexia bacterium SDU3-3]|nr:ABC transporter substrate-binding protein [Chloroflexia bacterium SDU3-3]
MGQHTTRRGALSRRQLLRLGGLAAASSLAPALAACSSGRAAAPARAGGPTTITEWGFGTDNTLAKARVQAFRDAHPDIGLELVPQINDQKVLTAVVSGEVPDLLWLDRNTIVSWAARGALEPIDDLMARDGVTLDDFYASPVEQVRYGGQTWAIPQFSHVRALWVNHEPLEQAGLSVDDVRRADWAALQQYGARLTRREGGKITRVGFDTRAADGFFWMFSWGNGGSLIGGDGRQATFRDAKNVDALQYVVDTANAQGGRQAQKAFADSWGWDAQHPFILNQVAITLYDSWLLTMVAKFAPEHRFSVLPFVGRDGGTVAMTTGQAWAMPRGARNREAAWQFMKFMATPESWRVGAQAQLAENTAKGAPYVPSLTGSRAADAIMVGEVYQPISPQFDEVVRLLPTLLQPSRAIPSSPLITELTDILMNNAVNPALLGSRAPADGLERAQVRAEQAIAAFA